MKKVKEKPIDSVRSSRDGHEFHEAWAARKALNLIFPSDGLIGIAVEGLSPADQSRALKETVEIADLTLYYGKHATFSGASSVVIVQLKYSVSSENNPFRASDAKKTIAKFAASFRSYKKKNGAAEATKKLSFELVTNRPIYAELSEAIQGIANGASLKGNAKKQADQFTVASQLRGKELVQFAAQVRLSGLSGNLSYNKQSLSRVLVDWSATTDALARARLGDLRDLVRNKAGSKGEGRNVIRKTDVLATLELRGPEDLFPCPESFPKIENIVVREQLADAVGRVPNLTKPLLVHADGGIGKTVFLGSMAKQLESMHEVLLFDCFGGGQYRSPDDPRHLPRYGLTHLVNTLACKGLCDPLIPTNSGVEDLLRVFRARLSQAVATLRRGLHQKQLLIFLDAIDNAAEHAKDRGDPSFPSILLESFFHSGPVEGVKIVASCRTYRRDISRGDVPCEEIELQPFSVSEAKSYLRANIKKATDTQIQVAYARSGGNPRILEHLAHSDRGLLDPSEIGNLLKLDDLLRSRIQAALVQARKQGYTDAAINTFLAGLSVLPPPVPLNDYADALDIDPSAVRSFAADLAPLLESTRHGLMFRDEPTETFVRESYAANDTTLRALADNLFKKQSTSVYAASSLPALLQKLNDTDLLFKLAFDDRFPNAIQGVVGKRKIRYARLRAAVLHASRAHDYDRLVHLLVELSTLAATNQRGGEYIASNPDLVIASGDVDATRRLFEIHTRWQGGRHARRAIASMLSGDNGDALRHAAQAHDWINHFCDQDQDDQSENGRPEKIDLASVPFCLIGSKLTKEAALEMRRWKDWYAYELGERLFLLLRQAQATGAISSSDTRAFVSALQGKAGALAASLNFLDQTFDERRSGIRALAQACIKQKGFEFNDGYDQDVSYRLQDGLLGASVLSLSMGLVEDARSILSAIPCVRARMWSYSDHLLGNEVRNFIIHTAIAFAADGQCVTEYAVLPQELLEVAGSMPADLSGSAFRKAAKDELEAKYRAQQNSTGKAGSIGHDMKRQADRFLDDNLESVHQYTKALADIISSEAGTADKPFLKLIDIWSEASAKRSRHSYGGDGNRFSGVLGRQLLIFAFWARPDLCLSSAEHFLSKLVDNGASAIVLTEAVAIAARRADHQVLAGKTAVQVKQKIESEDETDFRATLFAKLARAVMPASLDETAAYFRTGIDQMDAIGSGDYAFTNELLLLCAEADGNELAEADFHTLSNICELNMSAEPTKFPWLAFAKGMAKAAGIRGLAKLSRWNDRDKISLDYTLLPFLAMLLDHEKIDPAIALSLLRISNPAELMFFGTKHLAEIIDRKHYGNSESIVSELIFQFEQDNSETLMHETIQSLGEIAKRTLGANSVEAVRLISAIPVLKALREERNSRSSHRGDEDRGTDPFVDGVRAGDREKATEIESQVSPSDPSSVSLAIEKLDKLRYAHDLKADFLGRLRARITYSERAKYVNFIATLETLSSYEKISELKACRDLWVGSSIAIADSLRSAAFSILQIDADSLVSYGHLSTSSLKEIEELSGVAMPDLALFLVDLFATSDDGLAPAVWLALVSIICRRSKPGEVQYALKRLLNSNAAQLASSVTDGAWAAGIYPQADETKVAAGMIWLALGAPEAEYRWRASHSIRCLSRLGKWEVIDEIVLRFHSTDAHPFQAPELPFFFLHARLWLLIALARAAIDHPKDVAKHADLFKSIVNDRCAPHVLFRHFAAQALLSCKRAGALKLSKREEAGITGVNKSPFAIEATNEYAHDYYYESRPDSASKPDPEFHLEYDFVKQDVSSVGNLFGQLRWDMEDAITAQVRQFDKQVTSMHESAGRAVSSRTRFDGFNSRVHTYGQQLGWHALYFAAGHLLDKHAVVRRPHEEGDPWHEWFGRELLTREDGLWLSDGTEHTPLDTRTNVRERQAKGLVLTGDRAKLLSLLGIADVISEGVVVGGDWQSSDGVKIHIDSALVAALQADPAALKLSKEDPFQLWLPRLEEYEDGKEHSRSERRPFKPWLVHPSQEARLDDMDPFGAKSVIHRLRLSKAVVSANQLKSNDPFQRTWIDSKGDIAVRSQAWGRDPTGNEDEAISGSRLICSAKLLSEILERQNAQLVLMIMLRRYEKAHRDSGGRFWHTTAVVRISGGLDVVFYPGITNELQTSEF